MQSVIEEMTQAEFARHMGVSRAAVSQWKSKDILRDNAFTKDGKKGKVIVAVAIEQVRQNRDVGQALGNGIATRTSVEAPEGGEKGDGLDQEASAENSGAVQEGLPFAKEAEAEVAPAKPKVITVEDQLKQAKLEAQLRSNRIAAADEALRQGLLVAADDAREQMTRIAGMMLQIFEGALPDLASAVAAQFKVPQRDVLHLLRSEFKKVRRTAALKEQARVKNVDKHVTTSVEVDA